MTAVEVRIPELGDFPAVDVIEVHVKPGDRLSAEDPLVTLETDKATMDVPAPRAGTVVAVAVKKGDKVSAGDLVLTLEPGDAAAAEPGDAAAGSPAPSKAEPAARGSAERWLAPGGAEPRARVSNGRGAGS